MIFKTLRSAALALLLLTNTGCELVAAVVIAPFTIAAPVFLLGERIINGPKGEFVHITLDIILSPRGGKPDLLGRTVYIDGKPAERKHRGDPNEPGATDKVTYIYRWPETDIGTLTPALDAVKERGYFKPTSEKRTVVELRPAEIVSWEDSAPYRFKVRLPEIEVVSADGTREKFHPEVDLDLSFNCRYNHSPNYHATHWCANNHVNLAQDGLTANYICEPGSRSQGNSCLVRSP